MELNRFQMAAVKRTALNIKKLVAQKSKITEKICALGEELKDIESQIEIWEEPIKAMTGGYRSSDVIEMNGIIPDAESSTDVENVSCESEENENPTE